MGDSSECTKCGETIGHEEDQLMCGGVCGRSVHMNCTQLTKHALKAVRENENIIFSCDECITNSIKTVNNKVDGLYAMLNRMEAKLNAVFSMLKDDKQETVNEKDQTGNSKTKNEKRSYASVTKQTPKKVVLVRPKNTESKGDSRQTKETIKLNFDPKTSNITSVTNISKGGVAIECKDAAAFEKVKIIANDKMGDEYFIEEAKNRKPKVKIVGMSEKYTNEEIIEMLKSQNEYLANDVDLKIVRAYEVNKKYFSAIAEISIENQERCIQTGFVNISWDRCKVYEE